MHIDQLRARFLEPTAEDRPMPFWFWNDDLTAAEIVRQIDGFAEAGLGGFVIHPRIGLSREVGYLTDGWFALVRAACVEARRRGLKVILYDEGMYPSGASHGRVTRGRPELCARGLQRVVVDVDGPTLRYHRCASGEWLGDRVVAATLAPLDGETVRHAERRRLIPNLRGLVRLDLPAGRWRLEILLDVLTGGHIRGIHEGEDDLDADAPPAADLLNPAATTEFLRTTHEAYRAAVGEFFGETILAVFVDEPSLQGRGPRRGGLKPWTTGFEAALAAAGVDLVDLPALWDNSHPRAGELRATYDRLLGERLNETFYGPIADWCEAHGLALVGHPADSDDMAALERYTWPGQDVVWRYVEPGTASTTDGPHSTAARAATSAKRIWKRARAATECAGAYGWDLTAEELKGLIDWHLARGNDLIMPHAVYASIRGNRAYERPPCVGPNNVWGEELRALGDHVGSLAALLRLGTPRVETAIACDPQRLPWEPAKVLQQRQIDFDYVPAGATEILGRYAEVVGPGAMTAERATRRCLRLTPEQPDWRAQRVDVGALAVWMVANEGNEEATAEVALPVVGAVERWDPWRRTTRALGARVDGDHLRLPLELERREVVVLVVDPSGRPAAAEPPATWEPAGGVGPWQWRPADEFTACELGDWCRRPELETYAGWISYRATVRAGGAGEYRLDLGRVGEIARAWRGTARPSPRSGRWSDGWLGLRFGAPHRFDLGALAAGEELVVTVEVGNSKANELLGALRPSGLFGPVTLERRVG